MIDPEPWEDRAIAIFCIVTLAGIIIWGMA
jgi:hypothetical protein